MNKPTDEEITDANERISRPDGKRLDPGHDGKVFAGQRAEFAANPIGKEGAEQFETKKVAAQALRNGGRK